MAQWLLIGGGVVFVATLVVLRRRLMDDSGPGRLGIHARTKWDGRPRRATDRRDTEPR